MRNGSGESVEAGRHEHWNSRMRDNCATEAAKVFFFFFQLGLELNGARHTTHVPRLLHRELLEGNLPRLFSFVFEKLSRTDLSGVSKGGEDSSGDAYIRGWLIYTLRSMTAQNENVSLHREYSVLLSVSASACASSASASRPPAIVVVLRRQSVYRDRRRNA